MEPKVQNCDGHSPQTKHRPPYDLRSLAALLVVSSVSLGTITGDTSSQSWQLPSPQEASQKAAAMTPEELTAIEINDSFRDQLRFDPRWQPVLNHVRVDIMKLKWGAANSTISNPAWAKYGAQIYPLLNYYTRSRDPVRQNYGLMGIRSLGQPYTTLWLKSYIRSRHNNLSTYNVFSSYDNSQAFALFGLDNPKIRQEIITLAQENTTPRTPESESRGSYYDQFSLQLLAQLIGYDKAYGTTPSGDGKNYGQLAPWLTYEKLTAPTPSQVKEAVQFYRQLPPDGQEYIRIQHLATRKAGQINTFERLFWQELVTQGTPKDRLWALAELERHGDPQAVKEVQRILNGDLRELYPLSNLVSYESFSDEGSYAYYLLLGMVERYPNSRFATGCREYGDLTGRSYFGGEERPAALVRANESLTPEAKYQRWQSWISRYPDHPGADDASYFLAISLQSRTASPENQSGTKSTPIMSAMAQWLTMLQSPNGDQDANYLVWPHVRTILDVGLDISQLETLSQDSRWQPSQPLLRYALAVHYARQHQYAKALAITNDLDLNAVPDRVLATYYGARSWWYDRGSDRIKTFKTEAQSMLVEQRQRWQKLQQWQTANTPESQYQIAVNWTERGGWKNGYLPFWDGFRIYALPTGNDLGDYCQRWWICNRKQRSAAAIRASYTEGSQLGIALSLWHQLLQNPRLSAPLREKALYMQGMTLLEQWENHSYSETVQIHPPAGIISTVQQVNPVSNRKPNGEVDWEKEYELYRSNEKAIGNDYQKRLDAIIKELQTNFPTSSLIDDLLFSSFFMSEQSSYLQQIVTRYPQGDRAREARFLLEQTTLPSRR
jgi:hypothetical protein